MLQFIAQYWLQFLFGLIITGLSIALKKVWNLYKKEQTNKQNNEKEALLKEVDERMQNQEERIMQEVNSKYQEMAESDVKITKDINNIDKNITKLTSGLLSIQRTTFISTCKELLAPEHKITSDEYERLVQDHDTYNALGGNNIGDKYFSLVEKKFTLSVAE